MKTLRKTLCVVLAIVMMVGTLALTAGAATSTTTFTDDNKITYKKAVGVLTGIGVINGVGDGSFNPTGSLTREAAAKIICYMLLKDGAANLTATSAPFNDVAADRWSAPYIVYCVSQSILAGDGTGNFNPDKPLTGDAFGKMLLCALGYDAKVEGYVGSDWASNVETKLYALNLNDGLKDDVVLSGEISREVACQLAFNALTADMVEYSDKGVTVTTADGTVVTTGASKPTKVSHAYNSGYIDPSDENDGVMQFCEQYFPKLKDVIGTAVDDFYRPASEWQYKGESIGTFAETPDKTYTKKTASSTLYKDLGLSDAKDSGAVTFYVDGMPQTAPTSYGSVNAIRIGNRDYDDDIKYGGNGTVLEVYKIDNGTTEKYRIVAINTWISKVADYDESNGEIKLVDSTYGGPVDASDTYSTKAFAEDDWILYTYSVKASKIESAYAPTVTDNIKLTAYKSDTVYAGGSTYKYGAKAYSAGKVTSTDFSINDMITVYLDQYGYIMNAKVYESTDSSTYAYVIKAGKSTADLDTDYKAKLLFTDGTTKTVTTTKNYGPDQTGDDLGGDMTHYIVSFTINDDGEYKLTEKAAPSSGAISMTKGVSKFTADGNTFSGTTATIYLVGIVDSDGTTYSAYTGYSAVTSLDGDASVYAVYEDSDNYAKVVVIIGANETSSASNTVIVYDSDVKMTTDNDGEYYVYNAVVDGEITTVKVDRDVASAKVKGLGVYVDSMTTGSDGITTAITPLTMGDANDLANNDSDYYYEGTGTTALKNGTIGIGGVYYSYTSDCNFYYIDSDQVITAKTAATVKTRASDKVWFTINDDGNLTNVFMFYQEAAD